MVLNRDQLHLVDHRTDRRRVRISGTDFKPIDGNIRLLERARFVEYDFRPFPRQLLRRIPIRGGRFAPLLKDRQSARADFAPYRQQPDRRLSKLHESIFPAMAHGIEYQ